MSESHQSRATVVRVKGVSFNYLQFLWSGIGTIRSEQSKGNYAGAMSLVASFIDYLPDSIKDDFRERAEKIRLSINLIKLGRLPQIQKIPDFYIRGIYRNRLLQSYSSEALSDFINKLTTQLNKLGYMENLKSVQEGVLSDTEDWVEMQEKREKAGKKRKKHSRDASPTGTLD